jgi:MoaA/NifB/PqqE/SkfB family radical SAM enzyme
VVVSNPAVLNPARGKPATMTRFRDTWERVRAWQRFAVSFASLPERFSCRPTPKRWVNLMLNRCEYWRRRTRLWSYPWMLSLEPTTHCSLRCPYCFTGAGGIGRRRSFLPLDLYGALLDELGDYLILVKIHGWGEPLLCRHLDAMVAQARARGIWTIVNSHLSLPFDAARAEALIASGLNELVVSIDGAEQRTYERYRRGGRLAQVVDNLRLLAATKRLLGSDMPRVGIEFHPFPWNTGDLDAMRDLAGELDMPLTVFKGCMPGGDWDREGKWSFCVDPNVMACVALWSVATVAADGGLAPCSGTFYREDDMATISVEALRGGFRAVWNGERHRLARGFFRAREGDAEARRHVCFDCPNTVTWARWRQHLAAGGDRDSFVTGFTTSDAWNYFWNRRPQDAARTHTHDALATAAEKSAEARTSMAKVRRSQSAHG